MKHRISRQLHSIGPHNASDDVIHDLGSLPMGASKTTPLQVTVDPKETLFITHPARFLGDQLAPEPEDNTATEVTAIQYWRL